MVSSGFVSPPLPSLQEAKENSITAAISMAKNLLKFFNLFIPRYYSGIIFQIDTIIIHTVFGIVNKHLEHRQIIEYNYLTAYARR